ncbi:hypothetical protein [Aquimarina pacifica]|uniref:hypothetical protein n=1 Tax=Aquimarina pacifica TaxID=1296415 RepID=UPI0004715817|nr:hypothetical protein [Aquimarina pacifica]
MSKNLEVVPLTKKMLREGVEKNTFWKENLEPMAKSKARWLLGNTRIREEDYCGVIGYEDNKMISFIFMFPDFLNTKNTKKIYWMIAWWVDKQYKDTVLSTYIYNEAVNLAGKQVIIKSYTENVAAFYKKQPFNVIASRLRYTIFFSLDSSMLIGKFGFLKSFKFLIDSFDSVFGAGIRLLNKSRLKRRTKSLTYDYINQLDDDTWEFIEPLCKNDLIYKTREYVNWQINAQQYVQIPVGANYPFTSLQTGTSRNIYIHSLKIIKEHKIIGFLSYIINHNEFNVKYFLVKEDQYYDVCVDVVMQHCIKAKRNFIFTDDTKLSNSITERYTTIYVHKTNKKGLAHIEIKEDFDNLTLENRDGHFY